MIETSSVRLLRRVLLHPLVVFCAVAFVVIACHAPGPSADTKRTPVEKPWTKEAIEKHECLWLELEHNRRGFMQGPVLAHDEKGEYLTTKDDASVHLPLADVLVMDAVDVPAPQFVRTPIEKPWTKETVETHEKVWVESANGTRQLLAGPTIASDEGGEYVTTKGDAHIHLLLADVTVMDAVTSPQDDSVNPAGVAAQSIGGSFLAFWTVVLFCLPAIIIVALIA